MFICGNPKEKHIYNRNRSLINTGISRAFSSDDSNEDIPKKRESIEVNSGMYHCSICEEDISDSDARDTKLPCGHICCSSCWFEYLKVEIENAKVASIHCFTSKCQTILTEEYTKANIK